MTPADSRVLHTLGLLNLRRGRPVSTTEVLNALVGMQYRAVADSLARLVGHGLAERYPRVRGEQPTVRYEAVVR